MENFGPRAQAVAPGPDGSVFPAHRGPAPGGAGLWRHRRRRRHSPPHRESRGAAGLGAAADRADARGAGGGHAADRSLARGRAMPALRHAGAMLAGAAVEASIRRLNMAEPDVTGLLQTNA